MYTCICTIFLHTVKCPTLPIIEHMMSYNRVNTAGSTVTFECISGYSIVGPNQLYCQLDGSWNSTVPYCVAVTSTSVMSSSSILYSYSILHVMSSPPYKGLSTSSSGDLSSFTSSSFPSTPSPSVSTNSPTLTTSAQVQRSLSPTPAQPTLTTSAQVQTSLSPTPAQSHSSIQPSSAYAMDHTMSSLYESTSISLTTHLAATTTLQTNGGETISQWISPSNKTEGLLL